MCHAVGGGSTAAGPSARNTPRRFVRRKSSSEIIPSAETSKGEQEPLPRFSSASSGRTHISQLAPYCIDGIKGGREKFERRGLTAPRVSHS